MGLAALAVLALGCWTTPLLAAAFAMRLKAPRTISDLNCMAAGIFTGITFFHIISESFDKILPLFGDDIEGHNDEVKVLKVQSALFISGFVMMLWLDKMAFAQFHQAHAHHHHVPHRSGTASSPVRTAPHVGRATDVPEAASIGGQGRSPDPKEGKRRSLDHPVEEERDSIPLVPLDGRSSADAQRRPRDTGFAEVPGMGALDEPLVLHEEHILISSGGEELYMTDDEERLVEFQRNKVLANGLLVAFMVHSVIEGLAFGSETPDVDTFILFAIFAAHKGLDGLAVALPLSQVYNTRSYWSLVVLFSTATPLGLVISFLTLQPGGALESIAGIVEAISGGVFMYISLFHILAEELEDNRRIPRKILIFTISLIFMSFVEFFG